MDRTTRLSTRQAVFPSLSLLRLAVLKAAYKNGTVLTFHPPSTSSFSAIFRCSFASSDFGGCSYSLEATPPIPGGRTFTVNTVVEVHSAKCRNGFDKETRRSNRWVVKQAIEELKRQELCTREAEKSMQPSGEAEQQGEGAPNPFPPALSPQQESPQPSFAPPTPESPSSLTIPSSLPPPSSPTKPSQRTTTPTSSPPPSSPSFAKPPSNSRALPPASQHPQAPLPLPTSTPPSEPNPPFSSLLPLFILGTVPSLPYYHISLLSAALLEAGITSMDLLTDLLLVEESTAGRKRVVQEEEEDLEMDGEEEVARFVEEGVRGLRNAWKRDNSA